MKRKYLFLITTILLGQTCVMQAQTDNHITVTNDKTGKKEVIELPEAMTYNLDSLLNEYNAKTYLIPDTNCNMQTSIRYSQRMYILTVSTAFLQL